MDDAKIAETTQAFRDLMLTNKMLLEKGEKARERMRQRIAAGQSPDHYRYEWILENVDLLQDVMYDIAVDFNREHPDDRCSLADMKDILVTLLKRYGS